ncbi:hypothetical protein RJZ56_003806 [Blastomyces dermatitidis]
MTFFLNPLITTSITVRMIRLAAVAFMAAHQMISVKMHWRKTAVVLVAIKSEIGVAETVLKQSKHQCNAGKMASIYTVMKSGERLDKIISEEGVIGFDMEGAGGVWDNVPCIMIKGVCDYADSHKNKTWRAYAAASGASAAKTFFEYWKPMPTEGRELYWMAPFERNPGFVGHQHEINKMENYISRYGPRKIAICELRKTQFALELTYRMRDEDSRCSIFWILCTSLESVEQAYMTIAEALGTRDVESAEAKKQVNKNLSQTNAGK